MIRKRSLCIRDQLGFSLVEVIVVVAIMAVLGTVLVPQLLRYVNQNRATACQVDREGILAVYERCIYEGTLQLRTSDLENMLDGHDAATKDEVFQYKKCPLGGNFEGKVVNELAILTCSCDGHEEVVVDFAAWDGDNLVEGPDAPYDPATFPSTPEPEESSSSTEPPSSETPPADSGVWPYADHEAWDEVNGYTVRAPGGYVWIEAPVKFTTREGNTYVIVDRGSENPGHFKVHWEWNLGPENIDVRKFEGVISYSGLTITDLSTVKYTNPDPKDQSQKITGIHYGDIVVLEDGKEYIYGTLDPTDPIPLPTVDNLGNFFWVGEDKTVK